MPIYVYECKKCDSKAEAIKSADDYKKPLDIEVDDMVDLKVEDDTCNHEWEKVYGAGVTVRYGIGWEGKGNW
jgi:predicted nucleic acid-binding Zn ribbon protein